MRFIPQYEPLLLPEYADQVADQIRSGWVGPDKRTREFEEKICEITGAKHAFATTSGTTAIILAILGLDLKPKSKILFPSYTFLAGANAARFLGHDVCLVDISHNTLSMDDKLAVLKNDFDAAIYVNHNAYVGPQVSEIRSLCNQRGVPMLEDSSQALGVPTAGRTGQVGVFSFSVPKLITTGQGGAVITDDDNVAERVRRWRDHGEDWRKTRIHNYLGVNFKFNDILASFGLAQLNNIQTLLAERKRIFDRYRKWIKIKDFDMESTWMVIYPTWRPIEIINKLRENDIQAVQYYRPVNHNPPYADGKTYAVAEFVYEQYLYLPSSLNLADEEIDRICEIILHAES